MSSNNAYFFTFPFPIYVDTNSEISIEERRINRCNFRIYPMFRSGPANFIAAPSLNPSEVPLPDGDKGIKKTNELSFFSQPVVFIHAMAQESGVGGIIILQKSFEGQSLRYFPMDSLRIDVMSSLESSNAVSVLVNNLLNWIRVETQQWWIGRELPTGANHYLRTIIPINQKGFFKNEGHESRSGFTTMRNDELPLTKEIIFCVINHIERNDLLENYLVLILDAKYYAAINELRRAVIDAAIACEQAKDRVFISIIEGQWGLKFKHGKYLSGYNLVSHINQDLNKLIGVQFKDDNEEANEGVDFLWSCRGDLAHGKAKVIDRDDVSKMIDNAVICINWLEGVRKKIWEIKK